VTVKLQNESLAQYQLLEPIGAGALGELFRARDTLHGRSVAVRIVSEELATDAETRRRILDAGARAAALSHPGIAATYEAGEADGRLFIATEYVPGEPLSRAVSGLPLHPKRAIEIAIQTADALAELHAADLVHGDVQPATIRLTPKGQAKLIDAGLTAWTGSGRLRSRASDLVSGEARADGETLAWMSPEQAIGERIDHRSDLFSLGSVLYLMLTGTAPFAGASAPDTILNVLQATPQAPRTRQPELPIGVDDVIRRTLSKSLD
jgi:serine/threonine protein kinase